MRCIRDAKDTYESPEIVAEHARSSYVTPAETVIFEQDLPPRSIILEFGAGGGRLSRFLSVRSLSYLGTDYAPAMVEACLLRLPNLRFQVAGASDLGGCETGACDAVMFAFNGLGHLVPDDKRAACFREVHRILSPGGLWVFSLHHARSIMLRPQPWDGWGTLRSWLGCCCRSTLRAASRLRTRAYWRGHGYIRSEAFGGAQHFASTPKHQIAEFLAFGFSVTRVLGDDYPRRNMPCATRRYDFGARKARGMLSRLRSEAARLLRVLTHTHTIPAPMRPTVLIQSDAWGRVGASRADSLDRLRLGGLSVDQSPCNRYGLESAEDLRTLGRVRGSIRDRDGRPARMTANMVMGNADLRAARERRYTALPIVPSTRGLPSPCEQESLGPVHLELAGAGVWSLALHGHAHSNPHAMLEVLRHPGADGQMARALVDEHIPYLASATPDFNFALVTRGRGGERFLSAPRQDPWIQSGLGVFAAAFGTVPRSVCTAGYRFEETTWRIWKSVGVRVVQPSEPSLFDETRRMLRCPRNIYLEPALDSANQPARALIQAEAAVASRQPIVVCTHSINYMTRHGHWRARSLELLNEFLRALLVRFPDFRFSEVVERASVWPGREPGWWRAALPTEVAARAEAGLR